MTWNSMDKEEFISELITPFRCLRYWMDKILWEPTTLLELISMIDTNPKKYKWDKAIKRLLVDEVSILLPIGKCNNSRNEVFLEITITKNKQPMAYFKDGMNFIGILFLEINQKDNNKILLKSGITGNEIELEIDKDLIGRTNMYINGLISVFLEKIDLIDGKETDKLIEVINRFISLKNIINKNPKEFFSTENMSSIIEKVYADNAIRSSLNVNDSAIKIKIREGYSTPFNDIDSTVSLEYSNETGKCEAYLYAQVDGRECKVNIDESRKVETYSTLIEFYLSNKLARRIYINTTNAQTDGMSKEMNVLTNYINQLEIKEQMKPEKSPETLKAAKKDGNTCI